MSTNRGITQKVRELLATDWKGVPFTKEEIKNYLVDITPEQVSGAVSWLKKNGEIKKVGTEEGTAVYKATRGLLRHDRMTVRGEGRNKLKLTAAETEDPLELLLEAMAAAEPVIINMIALRKKLGDEAIEALLK